MWNARIETKSFDRGAISIGVTYSDEENSLIECYRINSSSDVDAYISSKLNQLNSLNSIVIELGDYLPKEKPLPDPFQEKLTKVEQLNSLVSIGIVPSDSPEFIQAIQDAKDEYSKNNGDNN